ncbi:MAG: nicotinate phosphoribosyltransferase [Alphaproteobacteria bacterium]|jgi:nicotinate phosphoribosyltransferase|nr:nicotinate phosphoribosyltransferase [Alphaproteobacteria bacterium]
MVDGQDWIDRGSGLLLTDLYQLNMLQAYLEHGFTEPAAFEFFVRKLPADRGFLMAAGLAQAVAFLTGACFQDEELGWLTQSGRFSRDFTDYLAGFRFEGALDAVPEGTIVFADEPIFRVTAPLPVAQLVETRLINIVHFETLVASKAARMVLAAGGRNLIDFGLRRAHGAEAGLLAARAAYLAGFDGTATTAAALLWEIPVMGTMAHSFIQAHDDETAAFEHFAHSRPEAVVLLIDTYDTEAGATKVAALAPRLEAAGIGVQGVRLDSGDLGAHAVAVRQILDAAGLSDVRIFASGGLDETKIGKLVAEAAPIDGFGVGTSLTTSEDAPAFDCAYKLQEYGGRPKRKRSEGKATWPGRKQVYRRYGEDGSMAGDVLALAGEAPEGEALVQPVLSEGQPVGPAPSLDEIRRHSADQLVKLPAHLRRLENAPPYPVEVSAALRELAAALDRATT